MHVHIINEWNVVSGPAEGTVSQEWRIARTHDRQWRKRKSTVLYYPRSTTEVLLYVHAVLEHSPWLSRRRDLCPNSRCHVARCSTWRYQDICVHIYRWCVRALNARQYATLPRLTPTERHVVMYDVWVFQRTPHCVRRCQIWLLQCCPILWLQRCQTDGSNVVNSPV